MPLAAVAGCALMATGVVGSKVDDRRTRRAVAAELSDPLVSTRLAAVERMAARPARYADALLRRVNVERDREVLDAIARVAIGASGARDASLVRLRLWALRR